MHTLNRKHHVTVITAWHYNRYSNSS